MFEQAMNNKYATHIDFGFLKGLIPSNPKVMPSNIDMVFERRGYFLFGEWKRKNEAMSTGQKIVLANLAKLSRVKVFVITGDTDNNTVNISDISMITKEGLYKKVGSSVEDLQAMLNMWYEKANGD
jgi:hypothetical protein